ncbi:formylmethanofuran dehydrogenase [Desulfofundulus thermobenzoicus]|uniref:Formylmethanofuran dehydrogenase n=1 Tax=Desulfofundulus thermobenzoicus TaxID=29376 RepID=A0A6N7ITQ6_9FIRM|nr:FmdE family protein [Desulfofundulus thermobenzoicus]MQL53440.1 formylmethanofuran dehydrogenase [Desulfofundulus thermobenzoicus]HHW44760.1 formylmethanofuran dehydrogenase [Desulfotomaculum sp.]
MCLEKTDWEKCAEFHGHVCPGLAMGYRAAKIGLQELAGRRAADEELLAIVENDACGVDAVMVLTGCTLGKGNLLYRDYGKHVYTFACRNSGKAVRVSVHGGRQPQNGEFRALREKVFSGRADDRERQLYQEHQEQRIRRILDMPAEEFCTVQHVEMELPPKARIFNSVTCAFCGEAVSEARARVREGKFACIPCAGEYSRGW